MAIKEKSGRERERERGARKGEGEEKKEILKRSRKGVGERKRDTEGGRKPTKVGRSEREEKRTSVAVTRTSVGRNVERPRWLVRLDSSKSAIGHDKYRSRGIKSAADLFGEQVRRGDPRYPLCGSWIILFFPFLALFSCRLLVESRLLSEQSPFSLVEILASTQGRGGWERETIGTFDTSSLITDVLLLDLDVSRLRSFCVL